MALTHQFIYAPNTSTGRPLDGVIVRMYTNPGNVLAVTYSDRSLTPKPILTTGALTEPGPGQVDFYIEQGNYDIEFNYGGDNVERIIDFPMTGDAANTFNIVTQPVAEAGVDNTGGMTPLRVKQAIDAQAITQAAAAASGGSALVGHIQNRTGAIARTGQAKMREIVSVLDFGADPTGVADSTAAFRLACGSTDAGLVAPTAYRGVFVPPGQYKILDTVYVRAGVSLFGDGMSSYIDASGFGASASDVFKMGWGLIAGVPTQDTVILSGGYPPEICNLFMNGGPSGGGAVVNIVYPGVLCHDIWFVGAGLAVYLAGGYLYDCEIDIGLTGVIVGQSTSQLIENVRFFNQNFAMIFDTSVGDITDMLISNVTIEYPKFAGMVMSAGAGRIRNLAINNTKFYSNEQYVTFNGFVSIANLDSKIAFNACDFVNCKGAAVSIGAAGSVTDFNNCLFDGEKSNVSYTQSTTFGGINISAGALNLDGVRFRNLYDFGLQITGTAIIPVRAKNIDYKTITTAASFANITNTNGDSRLVVNGLTGDKVTTFVNNQVTVDVRIKSAIDWFGPIATSGASDYVLIPYQASSAYMVSLRANLNIGGSGAYRKTRVEYVQKDNDFSGTPTSFVNQATAIQGAANTIGAVSLTAEFGSVGGGTSVANSNSGSLAISWPTGYAVEDIQVEML